MTEPNGVYLSLKLAVKLFGRPLEALGPEELRRVGTVAARQLEIETLIMTTPQAAQVILPQSSIDASLMEIRGRYGSDEDYHADLDRVGLDARSLRQAIERGLVVEAVLEKVAADSAQVSETEVEIFWFMNKERFRCAETRVLRHILVTINDDLAGNERRSARDKIDAIRARLLKDPLRFEEQALKHSECPTAMNGGLLGNVPRAKLYPELEAVAFALAENSLSAAVESELGYHLIYCEGIHPERLLKFGEAKKTIRGILEKQRRILCQKSWIKSLRVAAPPEGGTGDDPPQQSAAPGRAA